MNTEKDKNNGDYSVMKSLLIKLLLIPIALIAFFLSRWMN